MTASAVAIRPRRAQAHAAPVPFVPPTVRERAQEVAAQRREEAMRSRHLCELLAYDRAANVVYVRRADGNAQNNSIHAVNLSGECDCTDCTAKFGGVFKMRRACVESEINPDTLMPFPVRCKHFYTVGLILADVADRDGDEQAALDRLPTDLPKRLWRLCPSKFSKTEVYNG